ncbi:hypothetical protein FA15DRAFT_757764 [Coprinopsis marcescibilis]|uniref:F-box domain-containing protein n=1 Tax=Coprinopsis marcescibilis TaxID=230819 RepID=A0A5C3L3K8_COPMA|nr:hypothetical protein FA15DRAFT_757764 [Coprinopsis marcescibilis]
MRVTRGQTRANLKALELEAKSTTCGMGIVDGDASEESVADEDEDDLGNSDFEIRKGTSSAKRRKVSTTKQPAPNLSKAKIPARRGRRKTLSLFPAMPLDILFEILRYLTPKELLSVARTNKMFASTMFSSIAKTVWKAARERFAAPEPFSHFSEPQWASLLFESSCRSCGTKGVPKTDFQIGKRVCVSCKKKYLLWGSKFQKEYPQLNEDVLRYVPYTNVGGNAHGHTSSSKFYWTPDIAEIHNEWSALKAKGRSAAGKRALEEFERRRREIVEDMQQKAGQCRSWVRDSQVDRYAKAAEQRDQRLQCVKDRFKALGYTKVDLDVLSIYTEGICSGTGNVTDRVWKQLRTKLEPAVSEEKKRRVYLERRPIVATRQAKLGSLYETFKDDPKNSPRDLQFYPSLLELCLMRTVDETLQSDKDVAAEDIQTLAKSFPTLVENYLTQRKLDLLALVPNSEDSGPEILDLATSVFACNASACDRSFLIGWSAVSAHHCANTDERRPSHIPYNEPRPSTIRYHTTVAAVAAGLVKLAGIKPSAVTAAEMDEKNLRFKCGTAECNLDSMTWVARTNALSKNHQDCAFTWRAAIAHFCRGHDYRLWRPSGENESRRFVLVGEEKTREVMHLEANLKDTVHVWSCSRCKTFNASGPHPEHAVLSHLEEIHWVEQPKKGIDFFMNEDVRMKMEVPTVLPRSAEDQDQVDVQVGKVLACLRCPRTSIRRFELVGVTSHLYAKHKVQKPRKDVDWELAPLADK